MLKRYNLCLANGCSFSSSTRIAARFLLTSLFILMANSPSLAQINFIAQVQTEHAPALKEYITSEKGVVNNIIRLDSTHLICFNGDPGLKAKTRRFKGVNLVSDDPEVQWIDPAKSIQLGPREDQLPPAGASRDLSELQWGLKTIQAPQSWKQSKGRGVRVAVIDDGIDADHPDLKSNINSELSHSFVPDEPWHTSSTFHFSHGTHVAGIIAASDDSSGVTGVAPSAELVALKVASARTGSGDFSWLLEALVYVAEQEVDIANVSLGVLYPRTGPNVSRAKEMLQLLNEVTRYAYNRGVTLIAPAGDDKQNLDDCCIYLPANANHVIAVSATAPKGWAVDPQTNPTRITTYSNYGQQTVDFAAPGGDLQYPGRDHCIVASINRPCWTFDLVFSTISGGWGWANGTSLSAAYLSGVAALIHSKEIDPSPRLIQQLLIEHAIPKGTQHTSSATIPTSAQKTANPRNPHYGFGFANAFQEALALNHHEEESGHPTIEIIDGVLQDAEETHASPQSFALYQNFPNPFNPKTTINFHLPETSSVQIAVFDLMGSEVATLVDRELDSGCYHTTWNGRDYTGRTLDSGVYMYKINTGRYVESRVMTFDNN